MAYTKSWVICLNFASLVPKAISIHDDRSLGMLGTNVPYVRYNGPVATLSTRSYGTYIPLLVGGNQFNLQVSWDLQSTQYWPILTYLGPQQNFNKWLHTV